MHKLSRTSLASIVCPSAPFLAPRLLRTAIPAIAHTSQCSPSRLQTACYATKPKAKGPPKKLTFNPPKRKYGAKPPAVDSEITALRKKLQQACEFRNAEQMMDIYPTLIEANALNRHDTRRIAQALHTRARLMSKSTDIFPFIQQVVSDLRRGALEPHPYAFVHLLSIYKDCKRFNEGHELWQWLVQQDETFVSQAAYGAAIELMAYGGISSLPELEDLYNEGLKRFPGTFAEYHLSPDAIVPDRSQPTLMLGIPTVLLQGILTARMLARDWKRSYLALDTILRLYPTQTPPRFFELFMTERPVSEAYTAFTLACRAGTALSHFQVTSLLTKLRAAMQNTSSMADRVLLLRAVANALYAYQEAGGQVESIHVGIFIHCFEDILPGQLSGEDYQGDAAQLRNLVVVAAHEILSGLLQAGLAPQIHPFEALISIAGKMRVPNLLSTTLQDLQTAQIDPGPIGTRSALTSAGLLKNRDLVEQLWSGIVSKAENEGSQIASEDWITFVKACRRSDMAKYFHEQLLKLSHTTTSSIEQHLVYQINLVEKAKGQTDFEYMTPEALTMELDGLKQQVKNIETVIMSGSPLNLRTSPFYMHLDSSTTSLSSVENLRFIYDQLTTDPHQPAAPPPTEDSPIQPVRSSTGIPLDELRFKNWVTILEMMSNAEAYETHFQAAINAAIAQGTPLKDRSLRLLQTAKVESIQSKVDLRERIRVLRTPVATPTSVFRKIGSKVEDKKFKPMAYDREAGKWSNPTIRTHKSSKVEVRKHKTDARFAPQQEKFQQTPPKLRYYVGLESYHDAPATPQRKEQLDVQPSAEGAVLEPSSKASERPAQSPTWPSVDQLTGQS
ncbi:hypothetical protein FB567DRAFT_452645 [Paraphoma chrysanthemicola]|uniref:Uncharacterized protein n=1 Tax=Paraphoma chrysanthemicola TaxID=798071 RepID=A0A8K0QYM3_9PLEO|nr:hypothetical protein FB567DRAFT_452645 [Paraphoma chrysanthemicola]